MDLAGPHLKGQDCAGIHNIIFYDNSMISLLISLACHLCLCAPLWVRGIFAPSFVSVLQLWPLTSVLLVACSVFDLQNCSSLCFYNHFKVTEREESDEMTMWCMFLIQRNGQHWPILCAKTGQSQFQSQTGWK